MRMEEVLAEIKDLSPEDLRARFKELGENVAPIDRSSIRLFQKKLARKIIASRTGQSGTGVKVDDQSKHAEEDNDSHSSGKDVKIVPVIDLAASQFFGVCLPSIGSRSSCSEEDNLVFTDRVEALKAVKRFPGARFKVFSNKDDAEDYVKLSSVGDLSFVSPWKTPTTPRPLTSSSGGIVVETCPFKAPKPREVIELKKAIEKGDARTIETMIWENPRMLISSGDTPVILQESFRFNALHIAAKSNQASICQMILDTVEDPSFIDKLWSHTKETQQTRTNRINFLVDLYLNTPEKGNCDTPLHFACKFGYRDVVTVIISHPRTDKSIRNKSGDTPSQTVCTRANCQNDDLKKDILDLLEGQYYVPLLRSEDNTTQPMIGQPWSPDRKGALNTLSPVFNPKDPLMAVKACAGPMTPSRADAFHKRWSTPPSGSPKHVKQKFVVTRREDSDKGFERLGRELAHNLKVPWLEFWDFLQTYADLSSEDGLDLLEEYFQKQKIALCIADGIDKLDMFTRSLGGDLLSISQTGTLSYSLMALTEEIEKDIKSSESAREKNQDIILDNIDIPKDITPPQLIKNGGAVVTDKTSNGTPPSMKSSFMKGQNLYSTPVSGWLSRSMERSDIMNQSMESIVGSDSPISCLTGLFAKMSILDRLRSPSSKTASCGSCMGNRNIFGGATSTDNLMVSSNASFSSFASSKPGSKVPYFKEGMEKYNMYSSTNDGTKEGTESQNGVPVSVWKKPLIPRHGIQTLQSNSADCVEKEMHKNTAGESENSEQKTQENDPTEWRDNKTESFLSGGDKTQSDLGENVMQNKDLESSNHSELDDSLDELTNKFKHKIVLKEERLKLKDSMCESITGLEDIDLSYAPRHLGIVLEMDRETVSASMFELLFETLNELKNSPGAQTERQDIVIDLKHQTFSGEEQDLLVDLSIIPFHSSVAEISLFKDIPFKVIPENEISIEDVELSHLPSMVEVKFNFDKDTLLQALVINDALKSKMFYIHGYVPSKTDLDVFRAIESTPADILDNYPMIRAWQSQISSFTTDNKYSWQSPARVKKQSRLSSSFPLVSMQQPSSPVMLYRSPTATRSPRQKLSSTWSMPDLATELFPSNRPASQNKSVMN